MQFSEMLHRECNQFHIPEDAPDLMLGVPASIGNIIHGIHEFHGQDGIFPGLYQPGDVTAPLGESPVMIADEFSIHPHPGKTVHPIEVELDMLIGKVRWNMELLLVGNDHHQFALHEPSESFLALL